MVEAVEGSTRKYVFESSFDPFDSVDSFEFTIQARRSYVASPLPPSTRVRTK